MKSPGFFSSRGIAFVSVFALTTACGSRACGKQGAAVDAGVLPDPQANANDASLVDASGAIARRPSVKHVAFAGDGSLVVELSDRLVVYGDRGDKRELVLPPDTYVTWPYKGASSVITEEAGTVRLVALPSLRELHKTKGRALDGTLVESNGDDDAAAVLLAPNGTTATRLVPPPGKKAHVDAVNVTKSGRFAVGTWRIEPDSEVEAIAYDLATGRPIGSAIRMSQLGDTPAAVFDGDRQVGIRRDEVVVIDLASGAELRKARIGCPPQRAGTTDAEIVRGNPIVDPRGLRLVVTCNEDAVLIDARSLRTIRTFPSIVPGCDNGGTLPAHFSEDSATLVVEGCGGEAQLDLASGKYRCGDSDQLMGAPYEPRGPGTEARPAQSIGVRPCGDGGAFSSSIIQLSASYRSVSTQDGVALVGPGAVRFALPETAAVTGGLAVSPKEDRFAVVTGDAITVRALPGGSVLRELKF